MVNGLAGSGLVELATAYKAQAEAAGIRITINQAPAEDYWSNIWLKKPFIVTADWRPTLLIDSADLKTRLAPKREQMELFAA